MTALMAASAKSSPEVVTMIMDKGADVNAADTDGWTALMFAAKRGEQEVAMILLKAKADVNAKNQDGWTPLMLARNAEHPAMVELLKAHGATE